MPAEQPLVLQPGARILVIKLATAGDLLLTTPALRALRRRYPNARLDILTTPQAAPLLSASPLVDHLYTLSTSTPGVKALAASNTLARLRLNAYDATLLFHHLTLPAGRLKHRALLRAIGAPLTIGLDNGHGGFLARRVPDAGFGARHEAEYFLAVAEALDARLPAGEQGLRLADLGWDDLQRAERQPNHPPLIALHPGAGSYSLARRWPIENFVRLAIALHEAHKTRFVVVGGPEEQALREHLLEAVRNPTWMELQDHRASALQSPPTHGQGVTFRRRSSGYRALAETLSQCDLFIGNDSFPMHLATAVGLPVVAIFGPSNHRAWGPYAPDTPERVAVVRRDDLACSPCFYRGHALGQREGCPARPCLTRLAVEAVSDTAQRLLT